MNKSIFLWSSFILIMFLGGINCHNLILDSNIDKLSPQVIVEPVEASVETIPARITCYGWTGNPMANGKYPEYGYVATSDRTIPLGTEIIIDGETFIVGDRTALWVHQKWEVPTIDIYMDDCSLDFGAERKEIIINNK